MKSTHSKMCIQSPSITFHRDTDNKSTPLHKLHSNLPKETHLLQHNDAITCTSDIFISFILMPEKIYSEDYGKHYFGRTGSK